MSDVEPPSELRARGIVERAEWDDPDDRNERTRKPWQVVGWRRSDSVRAMCGERSREGMAATRLRDDVDLARGVRRSEALGTRVSGAGPLTPTEVQLDAIARVRAACRVLTPAELDIASWAIIEGATLASYETRMRIRHGSASRLLRRCLLALADHYERGAARR